MTTPTKAELIERFGEPDGFADTPGTPTNQDRIDWASSAMRVFSDLTHMTNDEPDDTIASDLICNLFHLVTAQGFDPQAVLDLAWMHFSNEAGLGYDA